MARPRKQVDEKLIYELALIHCTDEEISRIIGISPDTLHRHYAEIVSKGKDEGKARIRRAQIKYALAGNHTLLIWLGKCILQQVEFTQDEVKQIKEILIRIDPSRMPPSLIEAKAKLIDSQPAIEAKLG